MQKEPKTIFRKEAIDFQRADPLTDVTWIKPPSFGVYTGVAVGFVLLVLVGVSQFKVSEKHTLWGRLAQEGLLVPPRPQDQQQKKLHVYFYAPVEVAKDLKSGQMLAFGYDGFPEATFGRFNGTIIQVAKTVLLPNELTQGFSRNGGIPFEEPLVEIEVDLPHSVIKTEQSEWVLREGMSVVGSFEGESKSLWQWALGSGKKHDTL